MNELSETIAREIAHRGVITLARFMELALYCPVYGYYEKEKDSIGRRGDYYTSVSVGSLFGELLAWQFARWLENADRAASLSPECTTTGQVSIGLVQIVEAGAHQGQLAKDILGWLRRHRPALYEGLTYCIVEPSARRRQWQQQTLHDHPQRVHWVTSLEELSITSTARCVIFSNELLDSFPVHRLGWDAKRGEWFEWGVDVERGRFVWRKNVPGIALPAGLGPPPELSRVLPNDFTIEVCPEAQRWWRTAASILPARWLLTLDYGGSAEELFVPERKGGTLHAFRNHHLALEELADPGEQDLTAHVNFSALRAAGESAGLKTESFSTQEQFLTKIAGHIAKEEPELAPWTPSQIQQFRTLVHPEYLGRFRVLVQGR